jgi:hypothetical protein
VFGVLTYNSESYDTLPPGCQNGLPGKWLTPYIFVPPLAIFKTVKEAEEAIFFLKAAL